MKKKVAIALSGGVDSAVAAALLLEQGYEVTGLHLALWSEGKGENKCCGTEGLLAARRVAHALKIPFFVVDRRGLFKEKIVDEFLADYGAGLTPNPCIQCNRLIKFGEFYNFAMKSGFDFLATGHYARVVEGLVGEPLFSETRAGVKINSEQKALSLSDPPIRRVGNRPKLFWTADQFSSKRVPQPAFHMFTARDQSKDQSYFLYCLTQEKLAHILFPIGDYLKKEVREMAERRNLPVAKRPESQEICFLPENDYRPFLQRHISEKIIPGEVVDTKGNIIGRHSGLPLYTIGQRHGFTIMPNDKCRMLNVQGNDKRPATSDQRLIPPFYVIEKDVKKNRLIVGFGKETERDEFSIFNFSAVAEAMADRQFTNKDASFSCSPALPPFNSIYVRVRYHGEFLRIMNYELRSTNEMEIKLENGERGIAAGQSAVLYARVEEWKSRRVEERENECEVLGGGTIE